MLITGNPEKDEFFINFIHSLEEDGFFLAGSDISPFFKKGNDKEITTYGEYLFIINYLSDKISLSFSVYKSTFYSYTLELSGEWYITFLAVSKYYRNIFEVLNECPNFRFRIINLSKRDESGIKYGLVLDGTCNKTERHHKKIYIDDSGVEKIVDTFM